MKKLIVMLSMLIVMSVLAGCNLIKTQQTQPDSAAIDISQATTIQDQGSDVAYPTQDGFVPQ